MGALDGIRVLDLSRAVPGPYCTMLLADMGADVVLVEEATAPGGRRAASTPMSDEAAARNALRRNKRSIRLDLKSTGGREVFHRMAQRSDVVLEGFRPGVVKRLGVDYETLRARNGRIVYCSLSGYGQDGPYAAFAGHDLDYVAITGALGMIGRPKTPPAIPMNLVGDLAGGGLMAAFAITLALFARERSGEGQCIDLAMTDGVLSLLTRAASQRFAGGPLPSPGRDRITGALPNYDVYECKDGKWLAVAPLEPWFLANLYQAIGEPDLEVDLEGASPEIREAARARLRARFLERSRDEWFSLLADKDGCVTPVYDLDEALSDPHHLHRRMVAEVVHSRFGAIAQIGVMPKLSGTPGALRSAGPRPGEHTDEILASLGFGEEEIGRLRRERAVA